MSCMCAVTLVGRITVALIASTSGGRARSAMAVQSSAARRHSLAARRRRWSSSWRRLRASSNALMKCVIHDVVSRTHRCTRVTVAMATKWLSERCVRTHCKSFQRRVIPGNHHRLRGSASPVLTATGLSIGKGNFRPPTESTPLNRSQKICHR